MNGDDHLYIYLFQREYEIENESSSLDVSTNTDTDKLIDALLARDLRRAVCSKPGKLSKGQKLELQFFHITVRSRIRVHLFF